MPKTVTLRLNDQTYDVLARAASAQRRSLANLIETAALQKVREDEFVDEYEMAEIRANEDLVARLKEGAADARNRRGQFVD